MNPVLICIYLFSFDSVIRRIVTLLSAQASLEAQKEAALKQAQSASRAAESMSGSSDRRGSGGDDSGDSKLKKELEAAREEARKLKASKDAMERQSKNLT